MPRLVLQFWFAFIGFSLQHVLCFPYTSEATSFFRAYIDAHNFNSVNVYYHGDSEISLRDVQRFVSMLETPFVIHNITNDASLKNVPSDVLAITWMYTPSDVLRLKMVGNNDVFRTINWLIVGDPQTLTTLDGHSPYLSLDNKVVFANWSDERRLNASGNIPLKIQLLEAYQASPYLPYIVTSIGFWTNNLGLKVIESDAAARRANLTGLHLRCVTMEQQPFVYLDDGLPGKNAKLIGGFVKDVWDNLQQHFGFRYNCRRPRDNRWGGLKNGKWNGMIAELRDRSADVIVTSIDYTAARAEVIDYLVGIRTVGFRMVVRRPGLMESTWTSFTSELGNKSWIVTVCMIILVPLVLVFVSHHSPFEDWAVPLQDAYLLTLGALFFQGSYISVSSTSTRLVFITIFLATLLIYAHYTSALVAQLTIASDKSTPFTTLEGLLNDGRYEFGFQKDTSLHELFRRSKSSPYKDLWNNIVAQNENNLPKDDQDGLKRVKRENYVHLIEENLFNFEFFYECELMLLPTEYLRSTTGIAFVKNSPYIKAFNYRLHKLRDAGVLERMWKRWQPPASLCTEERFVALSIDQTFTAFLALFTGVVLATLVCLPLEKITGQSKQNKNEKFNKWKSVNTEVSSRNHALTRSFPGSFESKTGNNKLLHSSTPQRTYFGAYFSNNQQF